MNFIKIAAWIILVALMFPVQGFSQVAESEQVKKLGSLLDEIQGAAWRGRIAGVTVSLFVGIFAGAAATNGFNFGLQSTGSENGEEACMDLLSMGANCMLGMMTFGLAASAGVLSGLLTTVIFPFENLWMPDKFREMPESSIEEVRQKIQTGEMYLRDLAKLETVTGTIRSLFFFAVGATGIGLYFYYDNAAGSETMRYWALGTGIGFLGLGVIDLFVKETAEDCLARYNEWKSGAGLSVTNSNGPKVQILFSPVTAGVKVSF